MGPSHFVTAQLWLYPLPVPPFTAVGSGDHGSTVGDNTGNNDVLLDTEHMQKYHRFFEREGEAPASGRKSLNFANVESARYIFEFRKGGDNKPRT